jgi:glycerol kinase
MKSVDVNYGRDAFLRSPVHTTQDWLVQGTTIVKYHKNDYTNAVKTLDNYRKPLISDARTYAVSGVTPTATNGIFNKSDVFSSNASHEIVFEKFPVKSYTEDDTSKGIRLLEAT